MSLRYLMILSVMTLVLVAVAQNSQAQSPVPSKTAHENQQVSAGENGTNDRNATPHPSVPDASARNASIAPSNHKSESKQESATNWITWFTLALVVCALLQYLAMRKQAA